MSGYKKYGKAPFSIYLVHGGPGAIGDMYPVAVQISSNHGVIEIYNYGLSIDAQLQEICKAIVDNNSGKVLLIGHSWGAWLVFLFAARFPDLVKKIILVGSAPFESRYAEYISNIRYERLNKSEQTLFKSLAHKMTNEEQNISDDMFEKLRKLLIKADSYELFDEYKDVEIKFDMLVYKKVWPEADALRKSGELLISGNNVQCPVFAIHGDYDPHNVMGIIEPLSKVLTDFRYEIIYKCGHYPWFEKYAWKKFFNILLNEIL